MRRREAVLLLVPGLAALPALAADWSGDDPSVEITSLQERAKCRHISM